MKMKSVPIIWQTLTELIKNENLYNDVKEEINIILDTLKPLEKPNPVRVEGTLSYFLLIWLEILFKFQKILVKSSSELICEWDQILTKNRFTNKFCLYQSKLSKNMIVVIGENNNRI